MRDRFIQPLFTPHQAQRALLCFPAAGASADMYRSLIPWIQRAHRADPLALYAIEYPGHGTHAGMPLPPTFVSLVDALKNEVNTFLCQMPMTMVLGMSLGGMVSYEVLREIEQLPQELVIVSCGAPAQDGAPLEQVGSSPQAMYHYLSEDLVLACSQEDIELRWEWYQTIFAHWRTTYRAHPSPLLQCPLTIWYGSQDHTLSYKQCHPWKDATASTCLIEEIRGPHLLIHSPYFVQALLAKRMEEITEPDTPYHLLQRRCR